MEVFVIRHTRVAIEPNTCYGQLDIDVAETFEEEAQAVKSQLPDGFDAIYSSPLIRCAKLAAKFSEDIHFDDLLKEMHFGDWEGQAWNEIDKEEFDKWRKDFVNISAPQGENLQILSDRFRTFMDNLRKKDHEKVLLVTHGGVIRCIWGYLLDIPLKNVFKIPVDFGEILHFKVNADRRKDRIKRKM